MQDFQPALARARFVANVDPKMRIRIVSPESAPLDLLLSADPSIDSVREYLQVGTVFLGDEDGHAIAVAVLELKDNEAELKNIAVAEGRLGIGLGRQLLTFVLAYAAEMKMDRVVVGTGNSSLRELAFYQRNGFRVVGVIEDFFADYAPPIIENGIRCRDMIRLAIRVNDLSGE